MFVDCSPKSEPQEKIVISHYLSSLDIQILAAFQKDRNTFPLQEKGRGFLGGKTAYCMHTEAHVILLETQHCVYPLQVNSL